MAWRVAESLETLRRQLNAMYPNRSKASDGGIGDLRHQKSKSSDHNPHITGKNGIGVVTARDFTHDPANGLDCNELAKTLVKNRDPRIKYIIWARRICSSKTAPWTWRPYSGVNAHTKHLHLSVNADPKLYDSTMPWDLDDDVAKIEDDGDILDLQTLSAAGDPADSTVSQPAAVTSETVGLETPLQSPPPSLGQLVAPADASINTVVEKTVIQTTPGETVKTTTTASSGSEPEEVKKESPSLFVKIGAVATSIMGFGINLGSLVQTKIEQMTPQQLAYMIAALGLVALGVWWWHKSAKAAQIRTMQLVEKASDPNSTTVILK